MATDTRQDQAARIEPPGTTRWASHRDTDLLRAFDPPWSTADETADHTKADQTELRTSALTGAYYCG